MSLRSAGVVLALGLVSLACGGSDPVTAAASSEQAATAAPEVATTEPIGEPAAAPVPTAEPTTEPVIVAEPTAAPQPTTVPQPSGPMLWLTPTNLPTLGEGGNYEVWLSDGAATASVGTFDVEPGEDSIGFAVGDPAFTPTEVQVSVETDSDPARSDSVVLVGPLTDGVAELSTDHVADFGTASGQYILATPTDGTGAPENERSGVWWTVIPRAQSLFLPELPAGWIYEGWQIIDGQNVTTGTFTMPFGRADDAAPFSGPDPGPPLVGEDFLQNAPPGLSFPVDLRGTTAFISVEPFPDTGPGAFTIVPLLGIVPADAVDHVAYPVDLTPALRPSATATLSP